MTMVEMQKTSDELLILHGCGSDTLVRGLTIYDLHGNQEIESWKQILIAQQESDAAKLKASVSPSAEDQKEMIKDAIALGKPQIKSDQTLTFDFFLETACIVTKYVTRFTNEKMAEMAKTRRVYAKNEDNVQWSKIVSEHVNWEQMVQARVMEILYEALDIKKPVYEKTNKIYMMEP